MKVFEFPKQLPKGKKTLILGAFNSFHNGHKKLIEEARKTNQPIVIMIIEGISVLSNKEKEYTTLEIRLQQFANYGVDYVTVINFKDISLKTGAEFLKEITKQTEATKFIGGKDFAMGKGRDLRINNIENSIIVPTERISDKKISSQILKELVEVGDVKLIRSLSPYYYQMKVHVNSENELSKIEQDIPHPGIYSAWVHFNDIEYPATIHISMNKLVKINVPDFQVKNANYDPIISFVQMVRKIYKASHDKIIEEDETKVNNSLINSNTYL